MSAAATLAWGCLNGGGSGKARTVITGPMRRLAAAKAAIAPAWGSDKAATAARPGTPALDDAQALVQRCLHGDSAAWAELVRVHHGRVYGLCYRFTGSSHDAEDLTQEVFLKVWGHLRGFDATRGSFQTWLTTMTRNLLVDHFRRSKHQRVTDSIDAGWDEPEARPHAAALHLQDGSRSPQEHAMQRELETMVQQALTRVSPELREAVILRDLQDMDYKEIAQVLRVPEGTVKSRISRGRAELARLLESKRTQVS